MFSDVGLKDQENENIELTHFVPLKKHNQKRDEQKKKISKKKNITFLKKEAWIKEQFALSNFF